MRGELGSLQLCVRVRCSDASLKMRKEIAAVVFFLMRLVRKNDKLKKKEVEKLAERLTAILHDKFRGHWYPDNPDKGQAYRCIRVSRFQRGDPELQRACEESGVQYPDLGLPKELTVWVDPGEVCCRYGEKNHTFTIVSFSRGEDDDKEDITKRVTSAVDKVTSDYHSGSSEEEESSPKEPHKPAAPPPYLSLQTMCQVPDLIYQPVPPVWQQYHRKKPSLYKGRGLPHFQYGYQQQGRLYKAFQQTHWVLPRPLGGGATARGVVS
ncbi:protein BTG3 isoform X1 [Acipenser oxyrinchus oxyrinchus]|uniref:Protein BTG3 isoform X1 n=1 Tax=Acipenser oxyrinchus oxyrinchus TaxID=40147 RepID=A0AAD8DIU3_ACIOX|nr:protein BTG3 isoform X1 [Acipenser oxyrinchus oxyrinchus]